VRLDHRAAELEEAGAAWRESLEGLALQTNLVLRGKGLLWALDTAHAGGGVQLAERLLAEHRILVVPSGEGGSSITLYPPTVCTDLERDRVVDAIASLVG
jgi:acetylornithine/succinyldiaminopimelate/putrescine aminotransferase